jgi:L-fuculose-phosphate aldolase
MKPMIPSTIAENIAARVRSSLVSLGASSCELALHPGLEEVVRRSIIRILEEQREEELKEAMVKTCRNLHGLGFFAGTSGNVSARLSSDEILITPTGVNKGELAVEQIVKVNRRGDKLGGAGSPTSEMKMHLFSYEKRSDVNAIVHAHPPFATGFAAAGIPLDRPVLPEAILILGSIPLVEYGTPSTWEVPIALEPHLLDNNAFLLANHGTLTFGSELMQAAHRTETIELFAKIILIARLLGGEKLLTKEHLEKLAGSH